MKNNIALGSTFTIFNTMINLRQKKNKGKKHNRTNKSVNKTIYSFFKFHFCFNRQYLLKTKYTKNI